MHRRHILGLSLAALLVPQTALTAPKRYGLGPKGASITYLFTLNSNQVKGTVPVSQADLRIDPNNLVASTADVSADIRKARTGLIFATEALKSPSVLDARSFPTARFVSKSVILGPGGRISDGAAIEGALTLRGVTRPVRFSTDLYRKRGSAPEDLSALDVIMRGQVSRAEFGATGYGDIVDDQVGIDIRADIVTL